MVMDLLVKSFQTGPWEHLLRDLSIRISPLGYSQMTLHLFLSSVLQSVVFYAYLYFDGLKGKPLRRFAEGYSMPLRPEDYNGSETQEARRWQSTLH